MAVEPVGRRQVVPKSDELMLERVFKDYISRWFREKLIGGCQYEDAKKEIDFLIEHKEEIKARKFHGDNVKPKKTEKDTKSPGRPKSASSQEHTRSLERELQTMHLEIDRLKKENLALQKQKAFVSDEIGKRTHTGERDIQEIILKKFELEQKVTRLETENAMWQEEAATARSIAQLDISEKEEKIMKLNKRLEDARDEITDLKKRLIKLDGDKSGDENPDLAELSDPNRPTQLGTRFSEIYDNEWLDAYEALPKADEKSNVRLLHGIIQMAFKFCEDTFERQTFGIKNVLLREEAFGFCEQRYEEQMLEGRNSLEKNEIIQDRFNIHDELKSLRRKISPQVAFNIGGLFARGPALSQFLYGFGLSSKDVNEKLFKYAHTCAEICWFMIVCDPPMCLSKDKEGVPFSSDVYKPYTKSVKDMKSPIVELHVWPAVYLHLGGPVVAKGVAQPGEKISSYK